MYLRQKPADVCGLNCERRHPGCHADCEKYREFTAKRQEFLNIQKRARDANSYTADAIRKTKRGYGMSWKKYRPKKRW